MSFYYEHATKEYTGYFLEPLFWSSYAHSCLTGTFIQLKVEYKLLSRSLLFVEALTAPQSFFPFWSSLLHSCDHTVLRAADASAGRLFINRAQNVATKYLMKLYNQFEASSCWCEST